MNIKKYNFIDLWGYSIRGGVIAQTIKKIPDNISHKIRKIYYHNTFNKKINMNYCHLIQLKIKYINKFN